MFDELCQYRIGRKWLHTLGDLPTDVVLLVVRVFYSPVVWMINRNCWLYLA